MAADHDLPSQAAAALTSLLPTIQPVGSVALAALIFAESPTALQLLGVGMVLLALVTATRPARNRAAVRRAALTPEPSLEELTAEATLELERST